MTTLSPTARPALGAPRTVPRLASRLILGGLALLGVLQASAMAAVDPVRDTISNLVHAPGGALMFALSSMLTLAGAAVLLREVARRGSRVGVALLVVWVLALAAATVFPTDPFGIDEISLSSEIHRWAAAVMFTATPLLGWVVAHRLRAEHRAGSHEASGGVAVRAAVRGLRWRSTFAAVAGLAQILFSVPSLFPTSAAAANGTLQFLFDYRGLAERVLFIALMAVLAGVANAVATEHHVRTPELRAGTPAMTRPGPAQ